MFFAGADNRIRTGDLILTKDVLYLLSHISECFIIIAKECAFVNGFLNICGKEKSTALSLTSRGKKREQQIASPATAGRRGAAPCLGDANTHASHMC